MTREAVFSIEDGVITGLAGGPISLADVGERTTKRASTVEFSETRNRWVVTHAATGKFLAEFTDYDEAIAWEIAYFNQEILDS